MDYNNDLDEHEQELLQLLQVEVLLSNTLDERTNCNPPQIPQSPRSPSNSKKSSGAISGPTSTLMSLSSVPNRPAESPEKSEKSPEKRALYNMFDTSNNGINSINEILYSPGNNIIASPSSPQYMPLPSRDNSQSSYLFTDDSYNDSQSIFEAPTYLQMEGIVDNKIETECISDDPKFQKLLMPNNKSLIHYNRINNNVMNKLNEILKIIKDINKKNNENKSNTNGLVMIGDDNITKINKLLTYITDRLNNYHEKKSEIEKTIEINKKLIGVTNARQSGEKQRKTAMIPIKIVNDNIFGDINKFIAELDIHINNLTKIEGPVSEKSSKFGSACKSHSSSLGDSNIRTNIRKKIFESNIGLFLYTINVMNEINKTKIEHLIPENFEQNIKDYYYNNDTLIDTNQKIHDILIQQRRELTSSGNIRNAFKSIDESDSAKAQMRQVYNIPDSVASCEHTQFTKARGRCYVCGAPITANGEIEHKVPSVEFFLKFFKKTETMDTKSSEQTNQDDNFQYDTIKIYTAINNIKRLNGITTDKITYLYNTCYEIYCECIKYIERYYKDHEDKPYILSKLINFSMCHHLCNQIKNNISLLHRWKDYVKGGDYLNGSILLTYVNELASRIFSNKSASRGIGGLYGCEDPNKSRIDISDIKKKYSNTSIEEFKEIVLFNLSKQFLLMDVFVRKYKLEDSKNNKDGKMTQEQKLINNAVINPCSEELITEFWRDYINYRLDNKYDQEINQTVGLNSGYNSIKYELKNKQEIIKISSSNSSSSSSSINNNSGGGGVVRGGRKTRKKNKNKKKTKKRILKIKISKRKKTKKKYIK